MSAITNTSSFGKALWPGINAWYGKAYNEYPVEHTALFDMNKTKRHFEEDVGIVSFGLAKRKAEGASVEYEGERQGFITRYTPVEYALGFVITEIMMEDDLYNMVGERRSKGLAFSMRQTKEIVAANVYNRAFDSDYVGGDGKALIATDHPNITGGTWSNRPSTASDLSEMALEQACIDISKFKNDQGMAIAVRPKSLHIPVELMFEAERILKTPMMTSVYAQKGARAGGVVGATGSNTDVNDINVIAKSGKFGEPMVNHYFTDNDAWFIRTDVMDGMKYWERRPDYFKMDDDFDTSNAKYKSAGRYTFGWTDPRCMYASPGA